MSSGSVAVLFLNSFPIFCDLCINFSVSFHHIVSSVLFSYSESSEFDF